MAKIQEGKKKVKDLIPARWVMAFFGSCGFMAVYGLKVNLSVAIIAMVNHTAVAGLHHADPHHAPIELTHHNHTAVDGHHADPHHNLTHHNASDVVDCGGAQEEETMEDGPFAWDENIQGLILAAYFYGYIITQVPGGWIAEKFSAKHVFGVGTFLNAVLTLASPLCAKASYAWLVAARIGMGVAGGVTLPAMHVLIAKWAPPQERSRISSAIYAGMTLGTLICMPLSGLLASEVSWESVFYVQGGLTVVWYVLWLFLVFDSPEAHPRISAEEKSFIQNSLSQVSGDKGGHNQKKMAVPWKSVWTSLPVWSIIVAHTCCNWGWYMLLVKLPTYMRYILHFDIKSNAGLSAVPFMCNWFFSIALANVLDLLRGRGTISTTLARKLATFLSTVVPGVCLILVTYVGCNTTLAVVFLTLGTMFVGAMYSGFLTNHIDIAPPFAGTLMGISNTFATIPGIVMPSFIGFMTHGSQNVETWRTIFFVSFGIVSVGAAFFGLFGSGEQQEWASRRKAPAGADHEEQVRLRESNQ